VTIRQTGARRATVNSTARWPERLEHLAWLLRAEAVAVLVASADGATAVFSHRVGTADWGEILGTDVFNRAAAGAFATPVPAGRWGDASAFAAVAPVETWNGPAILCALRREMPFDPVDVASAVSAGHLVALMAHDGRALAESANRANALDERIAISGDFGARLAAARDTSAALAGAAANVAQRMGAGATSIMIIEGDELRLRAAVGLPPGVELGSARRVGEGIAGWVAQTGEKIVLRGAVADARFQGNDPEAREAVIVPLRDGEDVLGVLNVKRPQHGETFSTREQLLDGIATDLGRSLRALRVIATLERERTHADAFAEVALAVARADAPGAARAAAGLGHHAVALRDAAGAVIAVHADDDPCRDAAITASSRPEGGPVRVGFAKHGSRYDPAEAELAGRTADTLALLGRADVRGQARSAPRVLAVEDHPVMRLGVRAMLEREGFAVVGLTATCGEAIGVLSDSAPDVVLLDLNLPDASGPDAVTRMRAAAPGLPIVAFSIDRAPELVRAVLRAGASGFISKDTPPARVVAALHAALAGLVSVGGETTAPAGAFEPAASPEGGPEPSGSAPAPPGLNGSTHDALTPRELELLRYMAEGYTNKEIARAMVLAEDTVKKGVQMLIAKLGAADRTHAVVLALRNRLIE
jgi:DNA-binding NarL/FixJ family response regulator/putative methionine-R-sulfoxide reductase with GAF domain